MEEGVYCKETVYTINGDMYAFDENGYMISNGWDKTNRCYAKADGKCIMNQWIGDHFIDKDGYVFSYGFVDGYWIDIDRKCSHNKIGRWRKDSNGWWYQLSGVSSNYLKDCVVDIDQKSYFFNKDGYVMTNVWHNYYGHWYYSKADGSLAREEWIGDYYFNSFDIMETLTWIVYNGQYYYVDKNGKWDSNIKW